MQTGATDFFENLAAMCQNTRRHIPPTPKKTVLFNAHFNDRLVSRVEKKNILGEKIRILGYYNIVIIFNKIRNN